MRLIKKLFGKNEEHLYRQHIESMEQGRDVSSLSCALQDGNPAVRRWAVYALKRIEDKCAAGPLLERFLVDGREGTLDGMDIRTELREWDQRHRSVFAPSIHEGATGNKPATRKL